MCERGWSISLAEEGLEVGSQSIRTSGPRWCWKDGRSNWSATMWTLTLWQPKVPDRNMAPSWCNRRVDSGSNHGWASFDHRSPHPLWPHRRRDSYPTLPLCCDCGNVPHRDPHRLLERAGRRGSEQSGRTWWCGRASEGKGVRRACDLEPSIGVDSSAGSNA